MADIHSDDRIDYEDLNPVVPAAKSKQEIKPSKFQAQTRSMQVDGWIDKQAAEAWKRKEIRESTKRLLLDILHRGVWVWDGKESWVRKWHLVVRREINSPEKRKYSLSNASGKTPTKRLVFMQARDTGWNAHFRMQKISVEWENIRLVGGWHGITICHW